MAVKALSMVSGRVIAANILSGTKGKYVLSIVSRYGKVRIPLEGTKETIQAKAKKTVLECIPNSELVGMFGSNAIFAAPVGWKGGVNA
jgi:hypothetical protein